MVDFSPEMLELLQNQMLARLATASRDAEPHVVTIWFVFQDQSIYFGTSEGSKKLRNMLENPRVAFVVDDDIWDKPHSLMIFGRVEVFHPGTSKFEQIFERLCEKYPPEREYRSPKSRMVRIVPEKVVYWKKE
ncbi:MAG: pyridoxamine 5'-phosphate oxidase family protein [Candidatus Ranarchaeia archaeon]